MLAVLQLITHSRSIQCRTGNDTIANDARTARVDRSVHSHEAPRTRHSGDYHYYNYSRLSNYLYSVLGSLSHQQPLCRN